MRLSQIGARAAFWRDFMKITKNSPKLKSRRLSAIGTAYSTIVPDLAILSRTALSALRDAIRTSGAPPGEARRERAGRCPRRYRFRRAPSASAKQNAALTLVQLVQKNPPTEKGEASATEFLDARREAIGAGFSERSDFYMVTPASTLPPQSSFGKQQLLCPRCDASMIITYDEPKCVICGHVDYGYTPPTQIASKSPMGKATESRFRYIGDSKNLSETLVYARLKRVRNRVIYDVTCPFCEASMEQSSLSGKRREQREERYRCPVEHRVSLVPKRNGDMGWK